uniref:Uncharacterized protein n=1 Tax=Electrophorus electricus TaxID=8005 RepID=A0AAY5EYD1_ELEEL
MDLSEHKRSDSTGGSRGTCLEGEIQVLGLKRRCSQCPLQVRKRIHTYPLLPMWATSRACDKHTVTDSRSVAPLHI